GLNAQVRNLDASQQKELRTATAKITSARRNLSLINETIGEQKKLATSFDKTTEKIKSNIEAYALLRGAIKGVSIVVNHWADYQRTIIKEMGQTQTLLGTTSKQFDASRQKIERLSETYKELGALSIESVGLDAEDMREFAIASRRSADAIDESLLLSLQKVNKVLGLGHEATFQLQMALTSGFNDGNSNIEDFANEMLGFSEDIGANAGQMSRAFVDARGNIAQFGRAGANEF